jgi:hypothetical protein
MKQSQTRGKNNPGQKRDKNIKRIPIKTHSLRKKGLTFILKRASFLPLKKLSRKKETSLNAGTTEA